MFPCEWRWSGVEMILSDVFSGGPLGLEWTFVGPASSQGRLVDNGDSGLRGCTRVAASHTKFEPRAAAFVFRPLENHAVPVQRGTAIPTVSGPSSPMSAKPPCDRIARSLGSYFDIRAWGSR